MRRPSRFPKMVAVLCALTHVTCQSILTSPVGTLMFLTVNPDFIPSNGGVAIVSATLIEAAGTPVADGTVVQFFTTLGTIEEQGRTNDGVARVKLVSDTRSGTARVTAISGPVQGAAEPVTVGNVNAFEILMRANPPRITISNSTHVFASVFDNQGNPVPNVPVFFSVRENPQTEFFDITGPVFTNNNGEAENVMRTRRQTAGTAVVEARVPASSGTVTGELSIPIL